MVATVSLAADPTKDSITVVKENIDSGKAILLDVRELDEWNSGHLEAAAHLPLSRIKKGVEVEQFSKLAPQGKIVYLHCAFGSRSLDAADRLNGFKRDVRPLKQGYDDLVKEGFRKAEK
jgi:phage shock protein E